MDSIERIVTALNLIVAAAIVLTGGCSVNNWSPSQYRAQRPVNTTASHMVGGALIIETQNGFIDVTATEDVTDVQIDATIVCRGTTQAEADARVEQARIVVERRTDRTLVIKPQFPGSKQMGDGASFTVRLPDVSKTTLDSSNGSIATHGLTGPLRADTSNGRISVEHHVGDAVLDTSNASITVLDLDGNVELDTSNGRVVVERVTGDVQIDTSNGGIRVIDVDGRCIADTSNGSVEVVLSDGNRGPLNIQSSNASVKLTLGSAFDGMLRMITSNGRVKVNHPGGPPHHQNVSAKDITLEFGDGGKSSFVKTSNGSITLNVRDSSS